jgi:hypothetical protein
MILMDFNLKMNLIVYDFEQILIGYLKGFMEMDIAHVESLYN